MRRLKKLVADGAVGKIKAFQATNITLSPVWAFPWQGDPKASFGRVEHLKKGDPRFKGGAPNDRYTVQYTYFDEWVGLIDEFVDCIRNGKTPLINLEWHRETIQAMLGCYESIQSGKIAKLG